MTRELRLAVDYLTDLETELEARATSAEPRTRSAARDTMRFKLERTRELLADIERDDPTATYPNPDDEGGIIDILDARIWCHIIEARIMAICYDDVLAAVGWMQRAVALDPGRAHSHALLAVFLSDARQHGAALAAIERAINLEPDSVSFQKLRDDIVHATRAALDPTPDYPWWHVGKYLS